MGSKDSFNLFDSSAHKKNTPTPPKGNPIPKPTPEQIATRREKLFEDPVIKEAILKMEKLNKEISVKYKELIEMGGFTPKSITLYLQNPKNFNPEEWSEIQEHQQEVEEKLGAVIDPKFKELKKKKAEKEKGKERKGKTLGGRKRWLDMH